MANLIGPAQWDLPALLAKVGLRRHRPSSEQPAVPASVQKGRFCITPTDFGYVITYTVDDTIGESIPQIGRFFGADVGRALRLLNRLGRPIRASTFLDIGANIGTFSLYALKHGF